MIGSRCSATRARIARGRWRALTSLGTPTPSTACLGTEPLACVKMNSRILIDADSPSALFCNLVYIQ